MYYLKNLLLTDDTSVAVAPAPIMPRQDYEFHFAHRPWPIMKRSEINSRLMTE